MPASTPASRSERIRATPARARAGEAAVAEVVGQVLIFGILSVLLILSMVAFNKAQLGARDRIVELRAESAATRVAGIVVQTSLIAEQRGATSQVKFLVDLPQQIEGLAYTVSLVPAAGSVPAHVAVAVPANNALVTAALFSADAATATAGFDLCASSVTGGHLNVRFDTRPATCPGTHAVALFLESTA
jgi:hypothetical protein